MKSQIGATAIEFALLAGLFLMLLLGTLEFARLMMQINTVAAVSQILARAASKCDVGGVNAASALNPFMQGLPSELLSVAYLPDGCDAGDCQWVQVKILPHVPLNSANPFLSSSLSWPALTVTRPRETLNSAYSTGSDVLCHL
jgi:hypothetical protein